MNKKYRMLLLASYCGDDNDKCSEDFPCSDCLAICNVAEVELLNHKFKILGGFDYLKDTQTEVNNEQN